jgi:spore coat protein CotH
MKWLAVNTVIQNWDTYGNMTHNYYLYNDPNGNGLSWIPWDNNMALQDMGMRGGMRGALSIALDEVGNNWPLIRYLMDQPIYRALYISYVEETINGAFNPEKMVARYQELHHLIQPYVTGTEGEISGYTWLNFPNEFDSALQELIQHVYNRKTNVENYLNQQ